MPSAKYAMFDVNNLQNTATDGFNIMHSYYCYTLYHATYITPVVDTVIYTRLIQLPYTFQVYIDDSSVLCHCGT